MVLMMNRVDSLAGIKIKKEPPYVQTSDCAELATDFCYLAKAPSLAKKTLLSPVRGFSCKGVSNLPSVRLIL